MAQIDHLTQGPSQACDMSPSGSSTCLDSTFTPNIDRYRVVPAKNFIRNILADELRGVRIVCNFVRSMSC